MTVRLSLLAAAALTLAGCNSGPLSTAAAMRVEVEVYKGPLSKEPEVQMGELVATLEEASNSLAQLYGFMSVRIREVAAEQGRKWNPEGKISEVEFTAWRQVVSDLAQARGDVVAMQQRAQGFTWRYYEQLSGVPPVQVSRSIPDLGEALQRALLSAELQLSNDESTRYCRSLGGQTLRTSALTSDEELLLRQQVAFCLVDADRKLQQLQAVLDAKRREHAELKNSLSIDRVFDKDAWQKKVDSAETAANTANPPVETQKTAIVNLAKIGNELAAAAADQRAALAYKELSKLTTPAQQREYLVTLLGDVGGLARQLHAKALFWSGSHISYAFTGFEGVRLPASLAALLGTYADRLGPRADSLIKQIRGADREGMALSVALRETSPPAFLKQYIWNDAGGSLTGMFAGKGATRDRVREIERLYTDENWTNINTVFASGQGTVRMALIKDDIGNWNLKSFDQDPTELLNAYRNVGLAGLKAATGLISAAVSGGSSAAAMQALSMSNQLTSGTAPGGAPTLGSSNLAELRGEVVERLKALAAGVDTQKAALDKRLVKDGELDKPVTDAKTQEREARDRLNTATQNRDTDDATYQSALTAWATAKANLDARNLAVKQVEAERDTLPVTTLARAREILTAHEKVVDALEGAIVRNRSTTPDLKDALKKANAASFNSRP